MRRFEFPLERLLQVKRQLERQAELAQRRARQAVDEAQAEVLRLREQLQRIGQQMAAQVGCLLAAEQWGITAELSERLAQAIVAAETRLKEAEQRYQQAAHLRQQLATEVETLQTLRQQHWELWRQQVQKADQQRLDELGLRRWRNQQITDSRPRQS
ncbi:MAG: flagellar FliJ family protein [Thermogemmata sp.]|uniref:Flagellar FliJ protein n=1 Tax=Thermogemmata fonticola TaxID=2755323 RepID=A0A7V9AAA0_9BACT|nr:flagellar FliJ family protein [Thermogemmata fonticola]MBA2224838.1 flagellar FliJ family protein [Thermogemmata fonticola]MCX8138876.1 flagellar FliJ family protein [Gemmataceae bacterium]